MDTSPDPQGTSRHDVLVVGAGFAGLYMLHKARAAGLRVRVLEAGDDIGGTWHWNRYPGARCDIEGLQYSYSFSEELQQEWQWSERFATQAEILRYVHHVADRFDLRRDIQLGARVASATFDEPAGEWVVTLEDGQSLRARFCVMATGCLSVPKMPEVAGIDQFTGPTYHTGHWPRTPVDFTGQRVGVIGTGSSAIQSIPEIARQAGHLHVFQRTPHFSVPARNAPLAPETTRHWKQHYPQLRQRAREEGASGVIYDFATRSALAATPEERQREYEARWAKGGANFMHAFNDLLVNREANDTAADFVRGKIAQIVKDPETARALSPTRYPIGTKRICVDSDYYATYNRPNVTLVDLRREPLEGLVAQGVRTAVRTYELDALVFATGFDAMTGALLRMDIRGRDGLRLRDKWAHGPQQYLGLMGAGFPNLFTITGPGSPSVLSNVLLSGEHHVEWITDCIRHVLGRGCDRIEADAQAEAQWVTHVGEVAAATLYLQADSWYVGANVPGKPRVFMPFIGVPRYRRKCAEVAANGYEGFVISRGAAGAGTRRPVVS